MSTVEENAGKTKVARPTGDRLIVKQDEAQKMSEGGIALPDTSINEQNRGRVVAVGSGRMLEDGTRAKMEVNEGDTVIFHPHGVMEVELQGETYLVLQEAQVLLVI